jgi:hypothetical protein
VKERLVGGSANVLPVIQQISRFPLKAPFLILIERVRSAEGARAGFELA